MQVSPAEDPSTNKKSSAINRSVLNTMLLVVILVVVSAGGGYAAGFQMGKKEGAKAAVKKVTDLLNPLNAVSDNPLFPQTILGKVADVSKSSITVTLANGEEKSVPLNEKTKVSQQDQAKSISDIKKDSQVTVFTTGKDKEKVANRVVIR